MKQSYFQSTLAPVAQQANIEENLPWVEKYRPKTISDIAHQESVVSALNRCLETKQLPHLLFYGPPGTGKTSTILAVAKQLFGQQLYKTRVLELNASDDRGIAVVRDKIKKFAQVAVTRSAEQDCPAFKIIILDEADLLTGDAQSALRRVIEKFTQVTRFCLICNYISKVIDPLLSRCVKFRFQSIGEQAHFQRLQYICDSEGVRYNQDTLNTAIHIADGDLRKSITAIQSASKLYGNDLTAEMIQEVAAVVNSEIIDNIYNTCWGSYEDMEELVEELILDGLSPDALVHQFFDKILQNDLSDLKKAKISCTLAEVDHMLITGADERFCLIKAFTSAQEIINT